MTVSSVSLYYRSNNHEKGNYFDSINCMYIFKMLMTFHSSFLSFPQHNALDLVVVLALKVFPFSLTD